MSTDSVWSIASDACREVAKAATLAGQEARMRVGNLEQVVYLMSELALALCEADVGCDTSAWDRVHQAEDKIRDIVAKVKKLGMVKEEAPI